MEGSPATLFSHTCLPVTSGIICGVELLSESLSAAIGIASSSGSVSFKMSERVCDRGDGEVCSDVDTVPYALLFR